MRGLPDWGRPLEDGTRRAWGAFEVDGIALALPDTLAIAIGPDGRPAFRLAAFRPLIPTPTRRGYGRLDIDLRLLASGATGDGAVRAVPALRGVLRLGSDALALPASLASAVELDCSGTGLARLLLPLDAEGVAIIERALASGAAPLLATVDIEVAGVSARLPGRASVDIARLRSALGEDGLTLSGFAEAVAVDPAKLGIMLSGVPVDTLPTILAAAVADHVRAKLCDGPLRPLAGGGLGLVLADTGMATGTALLDLSEAVPATRAVTIMLDPFAAARDLAGATGGLAALTTRSTSAMLQSGQHEIVVDCSLARPLAGPLATGARLVFAPRPPARTHEVREDFELPTDGSSIVRQVRLAPNEPVAWTLTGFAYWPTADGRGVDRLEGPVQVGEGERTLLRPQDFPLRFVEVEAGAALLAVGTVEVTLGPVAATLSSATPRTALALPATIADPTLAATVVSADGAKRIALPPRTAADWQVELFDVPGYGARQVDISVRLPGGVALQAVDVLAEDAGSDDEAETYAFTATTPMRTHRWLCRDPFRPGLRWRWHGDAPFSAPVAGATLELTPEVVTA